ncbi:MAG: histidine--tRNA ligase, partial [Caldiserica bacterium]|nr:histidine--tRNA ligase [Caldisericota bacterium]
LPVDMIPRQKLFTLVREVFETFGYEPIETPSLEYYSTLTGKEGGNCEKLMYDFTDHGERHIGLIYELTISTARVMATYQDIPKPFKRYQIQRVWRAESPQKGRYREFYQCDFDVFGSTSMLADAEVVSIMSTSLGKLGFKDYSIHINHRLLLNGIMEKAGLDKAQTVQAIITIDKLDKIGKEGVAEELTKRQIPNPSFITEAISLEGSAGETLAELDKMIGDTEPGKLGVEQMRELLTYSQEFGSKIKFDPSLARGQTYYTGPIFEARVDQPKLGSLGGGGRYDELIGLISGSKMPAVGASLGLDRIVAVMVELGMIEKSQTLVQVQVCHFGQKAASQAIKVAQMLREAGLKTDLSTSGQQLGKQLSYASKHGVPVAVIIADDEVATDTVSIKSLATKQQVNVSLDSMVETVKSFL